MLSNVFRGCQEGGATRGGDTAGGSVARVQVMVRVWSRRQCDVKRRVWVWELRRGVQIRNCLLPFGAKATLLFNYLHIFDYYSVMTRCYRPKGVKGIELLLLVGLVRVRSL